MWNCLAFAGLPMTSGVTLMPDGNRPSRLRSDNAHRRSRRCSEQGMRNRRETCRQIAPHGATHRTNGKTSVDFQARPDLSASRQKTHCCQSKNCLLPSLPLVACPVRIAAPFERSKDMPTLCAASCSAVLKSTFRTCAYKSIRLRECFRESAKSPHNPALSPATQILKDLPGAPVISPTHQWMPSRLPAGKRYWARSATRSRNNSLIRFASLMRDSEGIISGPAIFWITRGAESPLCVGKFS